MPELPEVEQFRRLLLPLVSAASSALSSSEDVRVDAPQPPAKTALTVELVKDNPPRKWLTTEDVQAISGNFFCADVLRKGKLICMVLQRANKNGEPPPQKPAHKSKKQTTQQAATATEPPTSANNNVKYLYLHMGMTGRISAPGVACRFIEGIKDDDGSTFPPSHTYLLLRSGSYQVAFSDPRKFGSAVLGDDTSAMDVLAPDALHTLQRAQSDPSVVNDRVIPKIHRQAMAIKPLLMDQKRVLAGVGNWVADEVLYQCEMHPDQNYLTIEQATILCDRLYHILSTAVACLRNDQDFPQEWLFHYRWTNKKAAKDHKGRPLAFVTSGGRTSAIVASMQKLKKGQGHVEKVARTAASKNSKAHKVDERPKVEVVDASRKAAPIESKTVTKGDTRATKRAAQETATEETRSVRRKRTRVTKLS